MLVWENYSSFISGTRIGPRKKNFQMDLATGSLIGQMESMVVRSEGTILACARIVVTGRMLLPELGRGEGISSSLKF